MNPDTSMTAFKARGFSDLEAATRMFDCNDRDRLNALNEAYLLMWTTVLDPEVRRAMQTLRDESWMAHDALRKLVAQACAPWFEVHQ